MNEISASTETEIWSRAIRPELGDHSAQAAREPLRLGLSDGDKERVQELSARANAGSLAAEEVQELEHYLNVGRALEFLKAKARLSLLERRDAA